jgi:hypothetical protein
MFKRSCVERTRGSQSSLSPYISQAFPDGGAEHLSKTLPAPKFTQQDAGYIQERVIRLGQFGYLSRPFRTGWGGSDVLTVSCAMTLWVNVAVASWLF